VLIALSQIQTAYAQILSLSLEHSEEWFTIDSTVVHSVFAGDVDGDGVVEIVTGGRAWDGTRNNGQLRIWTWDGATLTLEHGEEWFTIDFTRVYSVFAGDVDGDGVVEIVTGGGAYDGTRDNGQLRIWTWDGATLTLEHSEEWFTIVDTRVYSVFAGDVDGDGVVEIVTGGGAYDGTSDNGQLRIWTWDGATLTLEHSEEWFTIYHTYVYSVFAGDVDGDGVMEVVTGGEADDPTRYNGQLRIWTWDGATLTLEHSEEWFTIDDTYVESVFAGDVDGDGVVEIVTGGVADDGTRYNGQLRIWAFLPPPVGGTVTPVNRLQLLAPLIYFTSLGFIAAAVALKRYRTEKRCFPRERKIDENVLGKMRIRISAITDCDAFEIPYIKPISFSTHFCPRI